MLVGEGVVNSLDKRRSSKNLVAHLVHGVLHTRAVLLGKGLGGDLVHIIPGFVEDGSLAADLIYAGESLPVPAADNLGAQNTVIGLGQTRVLVPVEAVECRSGALQDEQTIELGLDGDARAFSCNDLNNTRLVAVAEEGVGVRLAIYGHASPLVDDDLDVGGVDVLVGGDEVVAEDGSKELGRVDRVLLGEEVDGLLLGVRGDDDRVVGLGVAAVS